MGRTKARRAGVGAERWRALGTWICLVAVVTATAFGGDPALARVPAASAPASAATFSSGACPGGYTVTDVGTLPGAQGTEATAINAFRQVVGASGDHAFLWQNGTLSDLGAAGTGASGANAINASGDVVGVSTGFPIGNVGRAVRWPRGAPGPIDLGTFANGDGSAAFAISGGGAIAGEARIPFLFIHPALWTLDPTTSAYAISDLTPAAGLSNGQVLGMNASGDLVGWSAGGAFFRAAGSGMNQTLAAGTNSIARAVNDLGQVAGGTGSPTDRAFVWTAAGGLVDLGSGDAFAINNRGLVAGKGFDLAVTPGGLFLYCGGGMRDLNAMLAPGSGWTLSRVEGMNDGGQIVGFGSHNGLARGYLLDPTAAPATNGKIAFVRNNQIWTMDPDGSGATNVVTTPTGGNDVPSFSPDGKKIAFQTGTSDIAVVNADGTGLATIVPGVARRPTWSPDGTKIAYAANRDGLIRSIYVANADGTNETRLTNAFPYFDDEPAWSPDGTRVAFSTTEGFGRIAVVSANGSGRTLVSPAGVSWRAPAWSPDSTKIAARQHDANAPSELAIFVVNADGTNALRLTSGALDDHPAWSPDGQKIAFERLVVSHTQLYVMNADGTAQTNVSNGPDADSAPSWAKATASVPAPTGKIAFVRNNDIWVMNADGTGAANLTNTVGANDVAPAWSPDGKKIAFQTDVFSGGTPDIAVMNADGTGLAKVIDNGLEPTWSADGTRIAFSSNRDGLIGSIYAVDIDGTNLTRLTNAFPASDDEPAWSPDGTKVAFWTNQGASGLRIGVVNADGTGRTLLTSGANMTTAPSWSPDGAKIATTGIPAPGATSAIFVMNADGTSLANVTSGSTDDHPTWSQDGMKIAFARNVSGKTAIFVMNADGTAQTNISNSPLTSDSAPDWQRPAPPPPVATTTVLTSSANPSTGGQSVTLTATVAAVAPATGTPAGKVTFLEGATSLGTATLAGGAATLVTSSLTVGSHSLTARYEGTLAFATSTSAVLTQVVTAATATVAVAESIGVTDAPTILVPATIAVSETISVTDAPAILTGVSIVVAESIGVSDAAAFVLPVTIALSEAISVSDAPALLVSARIDVQENIAVSDASSVRLPATITIAENIHAADTVAILNTVPGSNVRVPLVDPASGAGATVTFAAVTAAGSTTLTTSGGGTPPPTGFALGIPPRYYDISTTAAFTPPVTVCIDVTGVSFGGPLFFGGPRIFHLEGGVWVDRTVSFDPLTHVICASVTSLSPFVVAFDSTPPATTATLAPAPNAAGWNRGPVTVTLTAVDAPPEGAGVKEIVVALTGATVRSQTFAGDKATVTISAEGTTTVAYFARDNNGNAEASRTLTVKIDLTPPEVRLRFDPKTKDLVVLGLDGRSGVERNPVAPKSVTLIGPDAGRELRTYSVADRAGNTVELLVEVKLAGQELKAQVTSLRYNGAPVDALAKNDLAAQWSLLKDGGIRELEQKIEVGKGEERRGLEAKFSAADALTSIKIEGPEPEAKLEVRGLAVLDVTTDEGKLVVGFDVLEPAATAGSLTHLM